MSSPVGVKIGVISPTATENVRVSARPPGDTHRTPLCSLVPPRGGTRPASAPVPSAHASRQGWRPWARSPTGLARRNSAPLRRITPPAALQRGARGGVPFINPPARAGRGSLRSAPKSAADAAGTARVPAGAGPRPARYADPVAEGADSAPLCVPAAGPAAARPIRLSRAIAPDPTDAPQNPPASDSVRRSARR